MTAVRTPAPRRAPPLAVLAVGAAMTALCPTTAAIAQPRVLTPDIAIDLRPVTDARLSPDGRQVVYRITRNRTGAEPRGGPVGELWMTASTGGATVRIANAGFDEENPRWSPNGRSLAWIARRTPGGPAQVFVRPLDETSTTVLTDAPGGVAAFEWAPDGRRIAFTAVDPLTVQERDAKDAGRDWYAFDADHKQIRLYTIETESRETTVVTRAELTVWAFAWAPDGSQFAIAATTTPLRDEQVLRTRPYVVSAAGGEPRLLLATNGPLSSPCWSADGQWLAWLGTIDDTESSGGSVFAMRADGSASPRNLTAGFEGTARWMTPLPGTNRLAFVAVERQSTSLRTIDPATGQMIVLNDSAIFMGLPSFDKAGSTYAVPVAAPTHPNEVYVGTIAAPRLSRITTTNPALDGLTLGTQETVRWRSHDGLEIEGILIKPVGFRSGVRYPVVVHVHGGPEGAETNGWFATYRSWGQLLAARGFVVVYPNYRGSFGRGVDFGRASRRDLMGKEWDDIETALDHVVALGIGDPHRAGIYGFSWGGYAAGWGATWASHRFKAAVGGAGIYNWTSEAGTIDTRLHEQIVHWGLPLYEHGSYYLERSPIAHIRRANTPMLLMVGKLDPSAPLGQSVEMFTALKWKGVPVELVVFPREGHGMRERPHQAEFLRRGLAWFDRYLQP